MAFQVEWLVKERVAHCRYYDVVDDQQPIDAIQQHIVPISDKATLPFHIIVDFLAKPDLHWSFRAVLESPAADIQFHHPMAGWTVTVAQKDWHFYYLFSSFLEERLAARIHVCHSVEAALAFLRAQDPTLPGEDH